MGRRINLTNNRNNVFYFIRRSKSYHASTSATYEIDASPLVAALDARRAAGTKTTITAALVKATALVIERHPQLNRHYYHGLFGRFIYEPDGIHCGLIVSRTTEDGEDIIVPAVIRDANRLSVDQIDTIVREYKRKPLFELPEFITTHKLRNAPRLLRAAIAFGAKTWPHVQEKVFGGTYALSAMTGGVHARLVSTQALSPTAASFVPGTIVERPWVERGEITIRKVLPMTFVGDHYVLDGAAAGKAMETLGELLASPDALGLPGTAAGATFAGASA